MAISNVLCVTTRLSVSALVLVVLCVHRGLCFYSNKGSPGYVGHGGHVGLDGPFTPKPTPRRNALYRIPRESSPRNCVNHANHVMRLNGSVGEENEAHDANKARETDEGVGGALNDVRRESRILAARVEELQRDVVFVQKLIDEISGALIFSDDMALRERDVLTRFGPVYLLNPYAVNETDYRRPDTFRRPILLRRTLEGILHRYNRSPTPLPHHWQRSHQNHSS